MYLKAIFKNPLSLWLKWYFQSRILLIKNRKKNLRIGYLSDLNRVTVGEYCTIYDCISINDSTLGNYVYIGPGTKIRNASIGNFCSIGANIQIGLGMHPTDYISTFPAFFSSRKQCQITFSEKDYFAEIGKVIIGNDVWIGNNAIIMYNLIIGDGAVIGAGAIVTKDVEPYTIVAGVPAKAIKMRFSKEQIETLLRIKWWEKDKAWLIAHASLFNEPSAFFTQFQ